MLKCGASFLSGGMAAVRRQAQRKLRHSNNGRGFLPALGWCATLNLIIVVEPDATLRPGELEPLLEELQRRIGAALERALNGVAAKVRIEDVGLSFAKETPVFPIVADSRVFNDPGPVAEAGEALCQNAGIGNLVYDAGGRAFTAASGRAVRG